MATNFAKTLVWKHEYDVKLWRHKEHTPNANDHHMSLNETPPWKFSAYATDIECHVLNTVNIENEDCENLWLELKLNQKKYAVDVVYRHPTPNFKAFSEKLFSVITNFNNTNYTHYICGDFNISLVNHPSEKNVSRLCGHATKSIMCNTSW